MAFPNFWPFATFPYFGHRVCWALIDDGPALRMSSPGTPSSPAAFPNFICFSASSTSLSSGAGSVLVNGALVTGISLSGFAKRSCPCPFHRLRTCSGSVSVFPFFYKILNNILEINPSTSLLTRSHNRHYHIVPRSRLNIIHIYPRSVRIWKIIPKEITKIKQPELFRRYVCC